MSERKDCISRQQPELTAKRYIAEKQPTLIRYGGVWFSWDASGAYRAMKDDQIKADVYSFLVASKQWVVTDRETRAGKPVPFDPKPRDVSDVYETLKNERHRDSEKFKAPCFLTPGSGRPNPRDLIACKNGLLNIVTGKMVPLTADFFTLTALPIAYDPVDRVPFEFLTFLEQVTDGRPELIDLVQEILGYLVSTDNDKEVVPYLVGRSRGGKSTLTKIITALVGEKNVEATPIDTFSDKHWAVRLVNASVALISDMNVSDKMKLASAANNINVLSGRDPALIRPMYDVGYTANLPTRVVMAGNSLPNFGEAANALANRLLIVPFDVSFLGREDTGLAARMIANELPAILAWSLDGLARLRARGRFNEPAVSKVLKRRLVRLAQPVENFVEDDCIIRAEASTDKHDLFNGYQAWCNVNGIRYTLTLEAFMLQLYQAYPDLSESRPRVDGKRVRYVDGIELNGNTQRDFAEFVAQVAALTMDEYARSGPFGPPF